jgi:hypothetical protein
MQPLVDLGEGFDRNLPILLPLGAVVQWQVVANEEADRPLVDASLGGTQSEEHHHCAFNFF